MHYLCASFLYNMDRNQVLGFFLMGLIFVAYLLYNQPSKEQLQREQHSRDSIAALVKQDTSTLKMGVSTDSISAKIDTITATPVLNDSVKLQKEQELYGAFTPALNGEKTTAVLENDDVIFTFSSQGGALNSAVLKKYKTYRQEPLELLNPEQKNFNVQFFYQRRMMNTRDLNFNLVSSNSKEVVYRLATVDSSKYIDFIYSLDSLSPYLVNFKIKTENFADLIQENNEEFGFEVRLTALSKEKNLQNEKNTSTVYFKYRDEDRDYISEREYEKKDLIAKTDWIAFKQQFFSTAILSNDGFSKTNAFVETKQNQDTPTSIKDMYARVSIPIMNRAQSSYDMQLYLGPNRYKTLASLNNGMEQIIDLGWGIFGWVNEFLVIPVFNFFDSFNWSYGIIILMLTLVFKILLFPVTYKNYISSAKMKVIKPEMDALNEKFKDKDPVQKQQAMMDLYRKTGVNPLAGCLPLLLQMPILFALFRFFPASIELRQEAFLWAEDLSTYDSVLNLSFAIPFYGDHVSLFAILMAISTLFYSLMNMQVSSMSGPQAAQMKIMMYLMPFMMLFFFNSTSSGLSYYYFAANMISIGQQWIIKRFVVDEKAILAKIEANKIKAANNPNKKSSFQKRLEEMAKARGIKGKN